MLEVGRTAEAGAEAFCELGNPVPRDAVSKGSLDDAIGRGPVSRDDILRGCRVRGDRETAHQYVERDKSGADHSVGWVWGKARPERGKGVRRAFHRNPSAKQSARLLAQVARLPSSLRSKGFERQSVMPMVPVVR